jgi:hypothetical protein
MSEKLKKTSENMSFSLSRWFRKLYANAPITFIVTAAGLAYAIFLFGGGLFTLINNPAPAYPLENGRILFLYPDISNQFGADTFISVILYSLGFFGVLSIYQSTKSANKPKQAYMLLIVGVALLALSYIFLETAVFYKLNPS